MTLFQADTATGRLDSGAGALAQAVEDAVAQTADGATKLAAMVANFIARCVEPIASPNAVAEEGADDALSEGGGRRGAEESADGLENNPAV